MEAGVWYERKVNQCEGPQTNQVMSFTSGIDPQGLGVSEVDGDPSV